MFFLRKAYNYSSLCLCLLIHSYRSVWEVEWFFYFHHKIENKARSHDIDYCKDKSSDIRLSWLKPYKSTRLATMMKECFGCLHKNKHFPQYINFDRLDWLNWIIIITIFQ
jgi:hypothetical protein